MRMSNPDEIKVTPSSGNVFEDMGLPDADERLAKAQVAYLISSIIKERGLTQTEAARILGTEQARISSLMRGRLTGFTLDRLFNFLTKLDRNIEVKVTRKPAGQPHGRVFVHTPV